MNKAIVSLFASFLVLSVVQTARATTVRAYSTQELVAAATLVAHGRVIETTGLRDASDRIVTDVRIAVDDYVVGTGPGEITVRLQRGEVEGIVRHVPGEARLSAGEETLLFLTPAQRPRSQVFRAVGLSQGVFRVVRLSADSVPMVTRSLDGLKLVDESPDGILELASSNRTLWVPLNRFVATVRELALP